MRYIIFSAIHKKRLVYDTLYSIMSIFHVNKENNKFKIIIYTDFASLFYTEFKKYNFSFISQIIIEEIDKSIVRNWINNGYVFNIKINVIKSFYDKYNTNALFIDSDMLALRSIIPLYDMIEKKEFVMFHNEGNFIMNASESIIKNHNAIHNLLTNNRHLIKTHYLYYRSGILGINSVYKNILDNVKMLCDQIYKTSKYRCSEELAFSFIFQNINNINTAYDYFIHSTDFTRLLASYIFNIYFDNDKNIFSKLLTYYNLDFCFLNKLDLQYEDIQFFEKTFLLYVSGNKLTFEKSTDEDKYRKIKERYINNRRTDLIERFNKI